MVCEILLAWSPDQSQLVKTELVRMQTDGYSRTSSRIFSDIYMREASITAMPTTLILGGSGKVARQLTRILTTQTQPPHTVHSVIRNPSQVADLQSLGAHPIVQSIEDSSASELAATIASVSPDCVVWSAGAGGGNPERTKSVDHEGALKSMDAVAAAGVKRYIIVSALDVRDRERKGTPEWYGEADRERSDKVWGAIGTYMRAKFEADRELRVGNGKRGLKYTIVRPGGLSMEVSL